MHKLSRRAVLVVAVLLVVGLTVALREHGSGPPREPVEAGALAADRLDLCGALPGTSGPSLSTLVAPRESDTSVAALGRQGVPWCQGSAERPGYANASLPADPVVSPEETQLVRGLRGFMLNIDEYTEPIYYSEPGGPQRQVTCTTYSCVGGDTVPVTGDEVVAPGSDGQLVVVDLAQRRSYELWRVETDPDGTVALDAAGGVRAGSMSVVDLDGRGNTSILGGALNITGAGLSRFFGVVRGHEVQAAVRDPRTAIPHALQVAIPPHLNCSDRFRAPATKTDGRAASGTPCVEQGARFQLDPAFDCTTVATPAGQAVCAALQRYGAYNADNGSSDRVVVFGQHVRSWGTGAADYLAAGVSHDFFDLGIPINRLRVLARWDGG